MLEEKAIMVRRRLELGLQPEPEPEPELQSKPKPQLEPEPEPEQTETEQKERKKWLVERASGSNAVPARGRRSGRLATFAEAALTPDEQIWGAEGAELLSEAIVLAQATLVGRRQTLGKSDQRTLDEATHVLHLLTRSGCAEDAVAKHLLPATTLLEEAREVTAADQHAGDQHAGDNTAW